MKNMFNWGDIRYEWHQHLSPCRWDCMCVCMHVRVNVEEMQGDKATEDAEDGVKMDEREQK